MHKVLVLARVFSLASSCNRHHSITNNKKNHPTPALKVEGGGKKSSFFQAVLTKTCHTESIKLTGLFESLGLYKP